MVLYVNRLKISPTDNNEDDWELLDVFEIHVKNVRPENIIIQVPKGFITNGVSVPRIFWAYLPRFGKYTKAAVVHDFLYNKRGFVYIQDGINGFIKSKIKRHEADLIFKKIMKADGVNRIKYWTIYHVVKWFGKLSWARSKQNEPKKIIKYILWCIKILLSKE